MPIIAQCQACKAKYNVPDTMAGKKVRCKKCGEIFGVPEPELELNTLADEPDLSGVGDDDADEPARTPILPKAAPKAAPRRPSVLPPVSAMPGQHYHSDEASDDSDDSNGEDDELAANPAITFPGSALIENLLPILIGAVAITWMVSQTLHADNSGRPWAGHLRWVLYLLGYVAIIYPLTSMGVRAAGDKVRFGLPNGNAWKIFGVFSLPFMLGIVLSLTGVSSITNYVIGIVVGLAVALGAFLFLYRLRPNQMGAGLGMVSGYFIIGCGIVALLGYGINFVLISAMKPAETAGAFPKSPLGPAFPWPEPPPAKKLNVAVVDATPVEPSTEPSTTTKPIPEVAVVSTLPANSLILTIPGDPTDPKNMKPKDSADGNPAVPDPDKKMSTDPTVKPPETSASLEKPPMVTSPLLAAAPVDAAIGEFEDISYSALGGPPLALIVKERGTIEDTLEIWSTLPFEKKGQLRPPHPLNERPAYWLGPKGTIVARMIDFPKKSIELRLAAEDKVFRSIELDTEHLGIPEIIGFAANSQIAVLWEQGTRHGIELFDTASGQRTRAVDLPGFEKARGNLAFSPDGRFIAAALKTFLPGGIGATMSSPMIQLSDVSVGRLAPRLYPVMALGADKKLELSGLAFSADSLKFSLLYEEAGNNLIVTWRPPETKQFSQFSFFSDRTTTAASEYHGSAIEPVPGAADWLVYGHTVIEADHVIGDLGVPDVKGHRRLTPDTLALTVSAESGKLKLKVVTLNPEKFPVKEIGKGTTKPKL